MPVGLEEMPRPSGDNGRGLYGFPRAGWTGSKEGLDFWVNQLVELRVKWFKVLDSGGDSLALCEKLIDAEIFPLVRILRSDPPPNDTPEPNPGHIGDREEKAIRKLVAAGVRYFETNNEPDLVTEWKHGAIPDDAAETAKLVALNWLFDARIILDAGGHPALPAVSAPSSMDLMGALVSLGKQDILLEGCWIAIHNHCLNRPLAFPDDPVNRLGQPLTSEQYEFGPLTDWVWWNSELGRTETLEEINDTRAQLRNSAQTILDEHNGFRAFEYYDHLARNYLGRSIPIISTDGGYLVGRRTDPRYGRVTPELLRDQTVAMYDFMQRQAPDYYFAAVPRQLVSEDANDSNAWVGAFWKSAFMNGTDGKYGFPPFPVAGASVDDRLSVLEAVKAMPSLTRQQQSMRPQVATAQATPIRVAPMPVAGSSAQFAASDTHAMDQSSWQAKVTPDSVAEGGSMSAEDNKLAESTEQTPAPTPLALDPEQELLRELHDQKYPTRATTDEMPSEPPATLTDVSRNWPADIQMADTNEDVLNSRLAAPPIPTTNADSQGTNVVSPGIYAEEQAATAEPKAPEPAAQGTLDRVSVSPPPSLLFDAALLPMLNWDPRLDALHVTTVPAQVATGQVYWKLVRAEFLGPAECDGKHLIHYALEDEQGKSVPMQRVWQGWPEDRTDATTNDIGEASIPLWASFAPERGESGPYSAWVDGSPCDRVAGMGLPSKRHVSFMLTWRRTRA